jgi:MFS family permease
LGRDFGWLWAAFAVSTIGTWLALDAFSLIAILVLHAGPGQVGVLAAAGLAVGALVAVPLGPWIEFRRRRAVMVAMDVVRFAALMSVPAAYWLGRLTFAQLLLVSVVVAAADIAFKAAGGAYLKALVRGEDLLVANARFESTTWTATALGPPLGGVAIGLLGPVTTVIANAASFLLSAAGLRAIGGAEAAPPRAQARRLRPRDLLDGWRTILGNPSLRPLFFNTTLVNGLILATAPLVAVLMLGELGFAPWQYGRVLRHAPHHARRRCAAGVLVDRAGLRGPGHGRPRTRHRGAVRPRHLRRRLQPDLRHAPARADADRPRRARAVGVVGHEQRDRRGHDGAVGRAGERHEHPHGDRDRRPAAPADAAAAAAARACAAPAAGAGAQPRLAGRRALTAAQVVISS